MKAKELIAKLTLNLEQSDAGSEKRQKRIDSLMEKLEKKLQKLEKKLEKEDNHKKIKKLHTDIKILKLQLKKGRERRDAIAESASVDSNAI